jgi:hypothetical protein
MPSGVPPGSEAVSWSLDRQDRATHLNDGQAGGLFVTGRWRRPGPGARIAPTADGRIAPTADGRIAPTANGRIAPTADGRIAPTLVAGSRAPPLRAR